MLPFDTPRPDSSEAWDRRKTELRETLRRLLGDLPPRSTPEVTADRREDRNGYTLEHFTFDNGVGDTVYGYVLIPQRRERPLPAILYHHYHGNRYAQGKQEVLIRAFAHWPGGLGLIAGEELVACLTRYQDLIAAGNVAAHGIYYYVPGMLQQKIDTESVTGLIAPRPHLTLTGEADTGSPADGVRTINAFGQHLYRLYGKEDHFCGLLYEGVGHVYTPAMWQETLRWLGRHV